MFTILASLIHNTVSGPVSSARNRFPGKKIRMPARESIYIDVERCTFCGICSRTCVSEAIKLNKMDKIIRVDHLGCILCGLCEDECPRKCITMA